jgi:hypothetical protein
MIDDADLNGFSTQSHRKARKLHRCGECRRVIEPGELYSYATGVNDGSFWSAKQCQHCAIGAALLIKMCGGFLYGEVQEDLEEHAGAPLPWAAKAEQLAEGMGRKWRTDSGELMPIPEPYCKTH